MKHYYIVCHDTAKQRWQFDYDATQSAFGIATMLDTDTGEWLRTTPQNASEHPDETRLHDQLATAMRILSTGVEFATVYGGCQLCDHEAEFYGIVVDDVAHFPCSNCHEVFTIGNIGGWAEFAEEWLAD